MDMSPNQKNALGFFLQSISGGALAPFYRKDLYTLFADYEPQRNPTIWGVEYRNALRNLPGEQKRDIVFRIIGNINTKELPPFFVSSLRSSIIANSPLLDGAAYVMLLLFENCIRFFPDSLGPCYAIPQNSQKIVIHFQNASESECSISLETGEFGSDFLMVFMPDVLLRKKYAYVHQPTPNQVDEIVRELFYNDRFLEECPDIAAQILRLQPSYLGPFFPCLQFELTDIDYPVE